MIDNATFLLPFTYWEKFPRIGRDQMKIATAKDFKTKYKMELTFLTDKELTPKELDNLLGHLLLQIEEPMNEDNEDEKYSTSWITYNIKKESN